MDIGNIFCIIFGIVVFIIISIHFYINCFKYKYTRHMRKKHALWSKTQSNYLVVMAQYFPTDITNLILEYIKDIPIDYEYIKKFPTINQPYMFDMDEMYLYTIEDEMIRKYLIRSELLDKEWKFCETRKNNDLFLYGIAINQQYIIIVNYITYDILIYTKEGEYVKKFSFNFVPLEEPQYLNLFEGTCAEITIPLHERMNMLKMAGNQQMLFKNLRFYSIVANNNSIYVSLSRYLLKFDFDGNMTNYEYDGQIRDLNISNNKLVIRLENEIIINDSILDIDIDEAKNDERSMLESPNFFNYRIFSHNDKIYIKKWFGYYIYDITGKLIKTLNHEYGDRHDKFYIANNKIYELTQYNDDYEISICELIYK